jgi:hypothetical protein
MIQNIFPLKPGFCLIKLYYDSHGTWKYFRLIKGPFKTGFTVYSSYPTVIAVNTTNKVEISSKMTKTDVGIYLTYLIATCFDL